MSKRILIIEDNPVNMELFTDLLEINNYTVIPVNSAEEGIDAARNEKPDLILIDIALPGMDGLTATSILKQDEETKSIPIVALTAHAMRGDEEKAHNSGCSGYITKPINTSEFASTVAKYLEDTD